MENFVEFLYSKFLQSDGVSIDTRTLERDNLFFGISGPNFNGSAYAKKALEAGASFAVVDDPSYANDDKIILCDNSEKALQDLAKFHRSRFKRPVFALTGSNGKTTTKELLDLVLKQRYITHATKGNLNNHLGVPLTLLHIYPQVEIAIIEMGANHVGEIASLCEIANPTHGLITNIGHAHTETFGGFEGVVRGKSELFQHLRANEGHPLMNVDDPTIANMAKRFEDRTEYPGSDVKFVEAAPYIVFEMSGHRYETQLIGGYNFSNIAAAIAVGRYFEVEDELIASAIVAYQPNNMRSQWIEKDFGKLILDTYNANPDSMKAAVDNLAEFEGRKVAILGNMNEVEDTRKAHTELVKYIMEKELDEVILIGANYSETPGVSWYSDYDQFLSQFDKSLLVDATTLVKASRSMRLERILDAL